MNGQLSMRQGQLDAETIPLRLGTRRSALALAQSGMVARDITERTGRPVELVEITTYGDTSREHLAQIGGTGVFVSALRDALLAGRIDLAVHSLKDLPTAAPEGLLLAAVPPREDVRDVLVSRENLELAELVEKIQDRPVRIGTGSPRRMAQLNAWARTGHLPAARLGNGAAIETVPIRGNVDTRIGFVHSGELDAVVLAAAGLHRLGRAAEISQYLAPELMLPAPDRARWPSSAAPTPPNWPPPSACWTTRKPGPPSPPSAPCWPRWRPAAPRRSPRWPRPAARTNCGWRAWSAPPTAPPC